MKEICEYDKCTGCWACVNACSHHAISMIEDQYGELHPSIDNSLCVDCGLCKLSCPNVNSLAYNKPIKCYAAFRTNKEKRKISASGGIGALFSEYAINQKSGVVFGTAYDKNLIPTTTSSETNDGIERFKGSKYVQSIVGSETFRQIRDFLKCNRFVLYIATPCQIAGLKSFLRKDYDNLITVDLICHGVCPTSYFSDEIKYLCQENKIDINEISDVRFRGNDSCNNSTIKKILGRPASNNYVLTLWKSSGSGKEKVYTGTINENFYLAGFLKGVSMRENCYSCSYARPDRISDITIGDFIGLSDNPLFPYPKGNVSSITTNTVKGQMFYEEILQSSDIDLISMERRYEERLKYKPSLVYPFPRHKLNSQFRQEYVNSGYVSAIHKTLGNELIHEKRKEMIHWFLVSLPKKTTIYIVKKLIIFLFGKEKLEKVKKKLRHI